MWLRMPELSLRPVNAGYPRILTESETLTLVPVHVREHAVRRCELDAGLLLRDRKLAEDALLQPARANSFV